MAKPTPVLSTTEGAAETSVSVILNQPVNQAGISHLPGNEIVVSSAQALWLAERGAVDRQVINQIPVSNPED